MKKDNTTQYAIIQNLLSNLKKKIIGNGKKQKNITHMQERNQKVKAEIIADKIFYKNYSKNMQYT